MLFVSKGDIIRILAGKKPVGGRILHGNKLCVRNSITISILTWVICLASSRDGVHGIPTRQPEKRLLYFKDLEKLGVWSPTNYDNDEWRFPLQPYKDDSNQKISSTFIVFVCSRADHL